MKFELSLVVYILEEYFIMNDIKNNSGINRIKLTMEFLIFTFSNFFRLGNKFQSKLTIKIKSSLKTKIMIAIIEVT